METEDFVEEVLEVAACFDFFKGDGRGGGGGRKVGEDVGAKFVEDFWVDGEAGKRPAEETGCGVCISFVSAVLFYLVSLGGIACCESCLPLPATKMASSWLRSSSWSCVCSARAESKLYFLSSCFNVVEAAEAIAFWTNCSIYCRIRRMALRRSRLSLIQYLLFRHVSVVAA